MKLDREAYPEINKAIRHARGLTSPFGDSAAADGKHSELERELDRLQDDLHHSATESYFRRGSPWVLTNDFKVSQEGVTLTFRVCDDEQPHSVLLSWRKIFTELRTKQPYCGPPRFLTAEQLARRWARKIPGTDIQADESLGGIFGAEQMQDADARLDECSIHPSSWAGSYPPSRALVLAARCYLKLLDLVLGERP